jgi:hypothetical protein
MNEGVTMQLYHFPSTNPQKVTFAFKELGLNCELVPVDTWSALLRRLSLFEQSTIDPSVHLWQFCPRYLKNTRSATELHPDLFVVR